MYKMKEVCQRTGLTEKTIRFYVEQNLVAPRIEPGLHYRSYRFSEGDIQRLLDIAALRSAEFSVTDIRTMLENPNAIPSLLAEKEGLLAARICSMQSVQEALQNLTLAEHTDLSQLADAIDPRTPLRKETPKGEKNRLLWLAVYAGLFLLLGVVIAPGKPWLAGIVPLLLAGLYFPFLGVDCLRYNRHYRKLPCRTKAVIRSVITNEGMDAYWPGESERAFRDFLSFGILHWSWICPDHWVPLIQFRAEEETITAAYCIGGLRNGWHSGEKLEIAWEPGLEQQVYPCGDPVLFRKAFVYLLSGIGSLTAAVHLCITLVR